MNDILYLFIFSFYQNVDVVNEFSMFAFNFRKTINCRLKQNVTQKLKYKKNN